jgi:hypothetical protein
MKTVTLDNNTYEFTYRSQDLFAIMGLLAREGAFGAANYCASHLLQKVEDNEQNTLLRFKLGMAILAEFEKLTKDLQLVKNEPAPSTTPKATG